MSTFDGFIAGDQEHGRAVLDQAIRTHWQPGGKAETNEWRQSLDAEKGRLDAEDRRSAEQSKRDAERREKHYAELRAKRPKIWTASSLIEADFPEPRWIVPGIVPEGFAILAGVPKLGKSWMLLGLALAVASGGRFLGHIAVEPGGVLLLSLEDTPRRLKNRLLKMGAVGNDSLSIATSWAKGREAAEQLDAYLSENPGTRLVGIDTLAKVVDIDDGRDYLQTYEAVGHLKRVADSHGVGIVSVHHVGKAERVDWVQSLMDSTGYGAAADTLIALTRKRGQVDAVLKVTGRDVEEQELALRFDGDIAAWESLGDASDFQETKERQEIADYLRSNGPTKSGDISKAFDKKPAATSRLLEKLEAEGVVHSPSYGTWEAVKAGKTGKTGKTAEGGETAVQGTFTTLPTFTGSDGRVGL